MKTFHICILILLPIEIFHNWAQEITIVISNAGYSFYKKVQKLQTILFLQFTLKKVRRYL